MAAKRILLFDGIRLAAHAWHNGHVHAEGEFLPDTAGLEAFAAYLDKHRASLFYLLADVTEEGFQLEEIPYVRGRDRDALITRRLGQYFYGTPLTAAFSLGRASAGRRDEKMLFAALTRPDTFTPWLDALRQTGIILAGIYSVPLVLAESAPRWLAGQEPVLLITLTAGGVRQSFFDQGKLCFSRLTQLATRSVTEVARTSAGESLKTYQYLVGQRQIQRGTTVRTVVLVSREHKPVVQEHCRNSDNLIFEFIDLEAGARREKLKDLAGAVTTDKLLMHWLAQKAPARQFAPAAERHFYHLWQMRFALTAVASIVLAGGLLFAAKTGFNVYTLRQEIDAMQARTTLVTQRYNALLDSLPKVSITPDNLRALMGRYEELQKRSPGLEPLLAHLSRTLNEMPRVELVSLDWKIAPRLDLPQKVGVGNTPPAPGNAAGIGSAGGGSGPWTVLQIQAQLPLGLNADLRAQKEIVDTFAVRLQDPQTTVQVLAMPFDIESGKPLKSRSEASDERTGLAPQFSLMIARPL